ncbi:hypothetical protein TNCV_2320751 [Trichonephila clavipes]|nr:hypothetical protein TNCV_2320751 [Trichonephila clavipes]
MVTIFNSYLTWQVQQKNKKGKIVKCNREFQIWWTEKHGINSKGDKAVCVLCSGIVVCRALSAKRYFETNHKPSCQKEWTTAEIINCLETFDQQRVRSLVGLENISLPFSLHAEIVEVEIEVVSPSIVPSRNFAELNRTVTCMMLKANDRRTSCPCHDEFRGPRSDYVRQVALEKQQQQQRKILC